MLLRQILNLELRQSIAVCQAKDEKLPSGIRKWKWHSPAARRTGQEVAAHFWPTPGNCQDWLVRPLDTYLVAGSGLFSDGTTVGSGVFAQDGDVQADRQRVLMAFTISSALSSLTAMFLKDLTTMMMPAVRQRNHFYFIVIDEKISVGRSTRIQNERKCDGTVYKKQGAGKR
jgi:hypothetical protein